MAQHPQQHPHLRRRVTPLLAALLAVLRLAGCGGSGEAAEETSPAEVMEQAKKHFDEASSVHIALSTDSTPAAGNGVLGATGTVSQAPAFEGDVKVILNGLTATVPVTSVDGKVYAKLPLQTKFSVIDPAEYGAPDPADFADPEDGLSALLTKIEGLEKGKESRSGDQILTTYSGSLPGADVKRIIPSADEGSSYETQVGVDEDGRAITVKVTGTFFSGTSDTTYDVKFDRYGEVAEITAPTS